MSLRLPTSHAPSPRRVGVLGGGQLARMLTEAAHRLGITVTAFVGPGPQPVQHTGAILHIGDAANARALRLFLSTVSVCAFESEFVSTDVLAEAAKGLDVRFYPGLAAMARLQDKLEQKKACRAAKVAASRHLAITCDGNGIEQALGAFGGRCVLKWARLGYDGKGVLVLTNTPASRREAEVFLAAARERDVPVFAEEFVAFRRELAVIGCRSTTGEFRAYPLVVSEQKDGICDRVYGPAVKAGVPLRLEREAAAAAARLAKTVGLVGSFGIEFFETPGGRLLVNEIAPRVHNTGHYTQDAGMTSQFENHWRALLGLPLGDTESHGVFAMQNILGPEGVRRTAAGAPLPEPGEHSHLHWYDKDDIVPRRKLGHLNGAAGPTTDPRALARELTREKDAWARRLNKKR